MNLNNSYAGVRSFKITKSNEKTLCGDAIKTKSKTNISTETYQQTKPISVEDNINKDVLKMSRGTSLKSYNLVLTISGKQNSIIGNTTKEEGLAYAVNIVNFVNAVFKRDLAVEYRLHPENDKVIYLNSETDPYPKDAVEDIIEVIETHNLTVFSLFDDSSFDTGFIIHPSKVARGGGRPGNAARAYVGSCGSSGSILHQFAHHLGGHQSNHLDSSSEVLALQRSTVGNNTSFLHAYNLDNISGTIANNTVGIESETGNSVPEIAIDFDGVSIPKNTPFVLTGKAVDKDADASLTYSWQQVGVGYTETDKLLFAHQTPVHNGAARYIPSLPSVLNNKMDPYTVLPEVDQEIVARLLVRDNQLPVGAITFEEIRIQVDASAGPFMVTYPNIEIEVNAGDELRVEWDVANTNNAQINTQQVSIFLSTDGGTTWEVVALKTANDGEELIQMPNIASNHCRIRIAPVNNIFYAVNDAEFSIREIP